MNLEFMLRTIVDKPAPSGTFDSSSFAVEYAEHVIDVAVLSNNGIVEWARCGSAAISLRAHGIPEDFVVQVTTTIEAD